MAEIRERIREVRESAVRALDRLGAEDGLKESGAHALHHFTDHTTEENYAAKMLRGADVDGVLIDHVERENDALAAHAYNQGAGLMVEFFAWMIRYEYGSALVDGQAVAARREKGTATTKAKSEPLIRTARDYIDQNPETNQSACVAHVAEVLGKDDKWVRTKVRDLFEKDPDRKRGKRPRSDLT